MNRAALKTYAPKARLDFIRAVTDRAAFFGLMPDRTKPMQETGDVVIIDGRPFAKAVANQRRSLEGRIQRLGFDQVMEAMAYTWFNRFVALRYMELHGYLDHGYRVLSHPEGKATPEIVEHAEHAILPGLNPQQVINLKLDGSREAELYRLLLVAQCNALHEAMPFLFEKIADETELLLPDNLLHSDSVIRKLVNEIEEADWQQVEIIGWLYESYISDKYNEVIGKVVKSEDIPAATQRFTPNWIVKYLVQNTLGRQWLATYPDSPLRQQMEYYIEPAEQTDDVKEQLAAITPKSLNPETLTLLDPASGSGHILVEAYDLFRAIYQERGYHSKDIPRLILEKNLFGLEIDDRAAQLAAFALLMKARADDRGIFADHIQPNVLAIQESKGLENLLRYDPATARADESPFADSDLFPETQRQITLTTRLQGSPLVAVEPCLRELIKLFEHGKTFGSLIRVPTKLASELPAAGQHIEAMSATGQLWEHRAVTLLLPLVKQAELLARTYDAVVTNPPYMNSRYYDPVLKRFAGENYSAAKGDLYGCFIQGNLALTKSNGFVGMITIPNWMFLSSFAGLRQSLLSQQCIESLVHNGRGVWGSDFGSCSFVIRNQQLPAYRGTFKRLFEKQGSIATVEELQGRFFTAQPFIVSAKDFGLVPGSPIAYWASKRTLSAFASGHTLGDEVYSDGPCKSGNDVVFLRKIWELPRPRISINGPWRLCSKGGPFRPYFGNIEHALLWTADAREHYRKDRIARITPKASWNLQGITWTIVSASETTTFRFLPEECLFNSVSPTVFAKTENEDLLYCILGFLNSKVGAHLLAFLNPTLALNVENLLDLPWQGRANSANVARCVKELVALYKDDWNRFETALDFRAPTLCLPPLRADSAADSWQNFSEFTKGELERARVLSSSLNEHMISTYGLAGELIPEVSEDQITLARADRERDIKRLLSYAIGCMVGRYSLDKPGLVYAHSCNEGFDPSQYRTFPADADGIIPITELAWFSDDAGERFVEFIAKAWPREHLEENLKFVADSLGPNQDEHPRDIIRRYLATEFYKDHLQTYKRRPIYWLFSSGKQRAFQCLVYLHRYHEGTLARMRTEYVIPLQGKLSQRIEQLAGDIAAATSTSHRRKLEKERETLVKQRTELAAFDEKLRHYADQRIALDLDDGVKVNYGKFGDLLAEVKAVTGVTEE